MTTAVDRPATRPTWRAVSLPAEHGGWGLTIEPGLLGLLIAPSLAGLAIASGAIVAFLVRTPLKIAAVDRRRGRRLARTRVAERVAVAELAVLAALAIVAVALAEPGFWIPGVAALPLFATEASFDIRSRGRRLVPELAGAIGICSVASMIVLAGGGGTGLAIGSGLVLAARSATSIPHVRAQIARLHRRPPEARAARFGDLAAVALAAVAVGLDPALVAGAAAVGAVIVVQRVTGRRPPPRPLVIGLGQMALGLGVVIVTAIGVAAAG